MNINELMEKLNTIMDVEVRNKDLLQRMFELAEIIDSNYITDDLDAELEYISIEATYAQGEWAVSCMWEDLSNDTGGGW